MDQQNNPDGLERCGITPEQWHAHKEWFATQQPLNVEIRIEGGYDALRDALSASGNNYSITTHRVLGSESEMPGPTGTVIDARPRVGQGGGVDLTSSRTHKTQHPAW